MNTTYLDKKYIITCIVLLLISYATGFVWLFSESEGPLAYLIYLSFLALAGTFYILIFKTKKFSGRIWLRAVLAGLIVIGMAVYFTIQINKERQKTLEEHGEQGSK